MLSQKKDESEPQPSSELIEKTDAHADGLERVTHMEARIQQDQQDPCGWVVASHFTDGGSEAQ